MCMVPVAKAPDPYKEIKVASDSHLGIPSQVSMQTAVQCVVLFYTAPCLV